MQTLHNDLPRFSLVEPAETPATQPSREFDLFDLARLAWRGWWIVAACIAACTVMSEVYLGYYAQASYRAEGQLLFHDGGVALPGATQLDARRLDDVLNTQVELILSSENLNQLTRELHLTADPVLRRGSDDTVPTTQTPHELRKVLSVSRVPRSFVVNLSAQSQDRTLALRLIDQLSIIHTERELARQKIGIDRQLENLARGLLLVTRDITAKNQKLLKVKGDKSLKPAVRIDQAEQITRDIIVLEQQHKSALNALIDLRRAREAVRSGVSVLSWATITRSSGSNALVLRMIAVLSGTMLAIGVLLWMRFMYSGVRSAADLAGVTQAPVLARVPRTTGAAALHNLTGLLKDDQAAESLRDLRAALLSRLDSTRRGQAIMVTASNYGEGTTTIAAALAQSLSAVSYRILLIEADMRQPRLARELGLIPTHGLEDIFNRSCSLPIAVQRTGADGPDVLVARPGHEGGKHASDVLGHPAFGPLIAGARKTYDMVIVAAPPCLQSADPMLIARAMDGVLYTARWNTTKRADIAKGLARLSKQSGSVIGVVLNQCRRSLLE